MQSAVNAIETTAVAGSTLVPQMSMWALFAHADIIGKTVIIMLILASFWSWAIIFEKFMRMRRLYSQADNFEDMFWSGGSLEDLYDRLGGQPTDPMSAMFGAAMREWRRSASRGLSSANQMRAGMQSRIERVMQVTLGREMDRLERYMTFLASVGSTAPFIGLFGTVWGIMNSFHAIAASKNTSIAVVAPGISEALFATALGLIAAIPAVIAYNKLSGDLARYASRLDAFSHEFGAIISRQLEEKD
ncbi:MAG: protein TolQ [Rhodospirillales bacterium]|nr:protein TolQ [Rhodospirillales bacterium]